MRSWSLALCTRKTVLAATCGRTRRSSDRACPTLFYLAIADDDAIRKVIANGVRGTAMPAFAESAGGMLTDEQIDLITEGIRSRSSQPGVLGTATAPFYASKSAGDAQRGEVAYKTYCESCHGPGGKGGHKAALYG